jgi:hypothetical protein
LLWGVRSDSWESPDHSNPLLEGLAEVPHCAWPLDAQTESSAIKVAFDCC